MAPSITRQPQSQTVGVGANAVFSVVAAGSSPLRYQWRFNGVSLSGAVGSSLTLTNAQATNSGNYSVLITNAYGSVTSSNAVLAVVVPVCVSAPTNLVSWWRAEGDGSDAVGTNSGSLQGGVTFGGGEVGRAFRFDGSSGLVSIPASASLNVGAGNGLTIECWMNPDDIAMRPLVEWNNGSSYGAHLWVSVGPLPGNGPGALFANLHDTGNHDHWISSAPGIVSAGNWQHVALTYDKIAGIAKLYYNGTIVATQTMGSFTPQTGYNLLLGRRPSSDLPAYYYGLLDEVSVYSRALSGTEIAALYSAVSAGKCSLGSAPTIITQPASQTVLAGSTATFTVTAAGTAPLSYQWRFNGTNIAGASGTSLSLSNVQPIQAGSYSVRVTNAFASVISSNAVLAVVVPVCVSAPTNLVSWWRAEGDGSDAVGTNSGSLQGGVTFAAGEVGRAFMFDGSSGLVSIPASASLNVGAGNGLTIECWINPAGIAIHPLVEWNNGSSYGVHLWISVGPPPGSGSGSLFANLQDTGNQMHWISSAPGIISAGNWQHVAVTYDKVGGVAKLYYNGAVVATQTMGSFTPQTGYNLLLGRRPSSDLPAYYYGLLDEVSLVQPCSIGGGDCRALPRRLGGQVPGQPNPSGGMR